MLENNDQIKGIAERALTVLVTLFLGWCVKKGWFGESESAALLPAIVLLPSIIRGYMINSNKSIVQSASAIVGDDGKKTVVLASPELAKATPDQPNIISNTSSKEAIAVAVAEVTAAAQPKVIP